MTQRQVRSKYPHIGWTVPPLLVLIAGIVLKSVLSAKEKTCNSTLGLIGRAMTHSTRCDTIDIWSGVATTLISLGGFFLVATLIGGLLRMHESRT